MTRHGASFFGSRSLPWALFAFAMAVGTGGPGCTSDKSTGGGGGSGDAGASVKADSGKPNGKHDAGPATGKHDVAIPDSGAADGGGAGTGSAGHGGDGGRDGSVAAVDAGLGDPAACAACEQQTPPTSKCYHVRAACENAVGIAARGPKASAPKSELCKELLACVWRTGCDANGADTDCLFGANADPNDGFNGLVTPAGACKDEIYAAAESTDLGTINNHYYDKSYAVGLAWNVTACDSLTCGFECQLCTPAPGSGPNGDANCHPQSGGDDAGN